MATKSLPVILDKQTAALEAQALKQLCSEGMAAVRLCAFADTQEGIDAAKEMYNEAQELARGLGYVLVCQPIPADSEGNWRLVPMELVSA